MTDLSICIPTFNRADRIVTLARAILAALVHGVATRKRRR